jgi:hypothetical protein
MSATSTFPGPSTRTAPSTAMTSDGCHSVPLPSPPNAWPSAFSPIVALPSLAGRL